MADIFLSYAREDLARIVKLAAALEAAGFSVWYDQTLRAGADFGAETAAALEGARFVVVVWSPHSAASKWVRDEAAAGRDCGKLIPLRIDGAEPPLGFRQLQTIDLAEWTGDPAEPPFEALLNALGAAPPVASAALANWLRRRVAKRWAAAAALLALAGFGAIAALKEWRTATPVEEADEGSARTAAPLAEAKSVAVLPFVALSSDASDGYFAAGLSEEIINALATAPDLLVTARTSAFHFKDKNVPIPEIAKILGVANVVEGSVRRSGERVRITAQLIRASDGFHLWSHTFDAEFDDDFRIQSEIAQNVAEALGVLLDTDQRALMADVGVRDIRAFLAYQRGLDLFNRAHNEGPLIALLADANREFERAIAFAPDIAQAHFQHADLYAHFLIDEAPGKGPDYRSKTGFGVDEAARRLVEDLDNAYQYEKDPGHRLVIKAVRTTVSSDWRNLRSAIAEAYAAWSNCRFGLWLDQTALLFGFGEAVHAHDVARTRCDPLGNTWYRAAESAIWLGRPAEGLAMANKAELVQGRNPYLVHARVLAHLALGHIAEAESLHRAGDFASPELPEFMRLLEVQIPAAAGRAGEWDRFKIALTDDPERLVVAAAVFGDRQTANRAAGEIDAMTLGPAILIRLADRCGCGRPFDLEATPSFARLLREADLPWEPLRPIDFPLKDW